MSARRRWLAGVAASVAVVAIVSSFNASAADAARRSLVPKACFEQRNQCSHACMGNSPGLMACNEQCTAAFKTCRLDALDATPTSSDDTETSRPATALPVGSLSAEDIRKIVARLGIAGERRLGDVYPEVPPECGKQNGMIRDPYACLAARARPRQQAFDAERAAAVPLVAQVERSMDTDLDNLPAEPVSRFEAVMALGAKYRSFSSYVGSMHEKAQIARLLPSDPLLAGPDRVETKRLKATVAATRVPEVKQAWVEGRVKVSGDLPLPYAERFDWNADRQTWNLQTELKRQGKQNLFSERRVELEQSNRERDQAGSYTSWGAPTPNEIGLALLRVYSTTGGAMTLPYESTRQPPTPLLVTLLNIEMTSVSRVIHVETGEGCVRADGGFACRPVLWLQVFPRGNGVGILQDPKSQVVAQWLNRLWHLAEQDNGKPVALFLQATSRGWAAPQLVEAVLDSDRRAAERSASMQKSNRCQQRKDRGDSWAYLSPDCSR